MLYEAVGTEWYEKIVSTGKGLRPVARWVMSDGLLSQFPLAKEQLDWVNRRARDDIDDVETPEQE